MILLTRHHQSVSKPDYSSLPLSIPDPRNQSVTRAVFYPHFISNCTGNFGNVLSTKPMRILHHLTAVPYLITYPDVGCYFAGLNRWVSKTIPVKSEGPFSPNFRVTWFPSALRFRSSATVSILRFGFVTRMRRQTREFWRSEFVPSTPQSIYSNTASCNRWEQKKEEEYRHSFHLSLLDSIFLSLYLYHSVSVCLFLFLFVSACL